MASAVPDSQECVWSGTSAVCGPPSTLHSLRYTVQWILARQDPECQASLKGSFKGLWIALVVISVINVVAALALIVHSYRRVVAETGRLKLVIKVKRPEKTHFVVPPIWLLWPGTLLIGLYHLGWCGYIWTAYGDGSASFATNMIKAFLWLGTYLFAWYFLEANFRISVVAADVWAHVPRRRTSVWIYLPPWLLWATVAPLITISLIATNNLQTAATDFSASIGTYAGMQSQEAALSRLLQLSDRARMLGVAVSSVWIVFIFVLLVYCASNLYLIHRAITARCDDLLSGSDHRPVQVQLPRPDAHNDSAPAGSTDPARGAGAEKLGSLLKGFGLQRVPSASHAAGAPAAYDDGMRGVVLAYTARVGTWAVQPVQQHKLKALKSIRRSHSLTTSVLLVGISALLIWSVIVTIKQSRGNLLSWVDSLSFVRDFVIAGALGIIELWALGSILLKWRSGSNNPAASGPAISALAAHQPVGITVQRPALWPNGGVGQTLSAMSVATLGESMRPSIGAERQRKSEEV